MNRDYTIKWCEENKNDPEIVSYLRMLERLDEAEALGRYFVKKSENESREMRALIRLGCVYHWQEKYDEAIEIFNNVIEFCKENNDYVLLGFVLQHKAKALIDMYKVDEAYSCAEEAYLIRKEYDKSRLESTRLVLNYLNRRA